MRKFLAVVKHEYKKVVLKWTFLIGILLFPFLGAVFTLIPALIFSIKSEPIRIVVVDPAGKIAPRVKENLSAEGRREKARKAAESAKTEATPNQQERLQNDVAAVDTGFVFTDYEPGTKNEAEIRSDLTQKITAGGLDAYLIIPPNFEVKDAVFEFRSRKAGDFISNGSLENAVNDAVRSQRLADANIDEQRLRDINQKIKLDTKKIDDRGTEKDNDGIFVASFIIGLMIYITLAIYGQAIMAAVVEEKDTRIAEILFSSARPFELMMGKLVGVGMAALTQLAIWVISGAVLAAVGLPMLQASGLDIEMPVISPLMVAYFLIFFLLGFFIYSSIFALIGAMVTSVQEGGQFSLPPILLLLVGYYFSFAVMRDPNSSLSFWVSIAPFSAPITMPVRILAETPPFWQIGLAVVINGLAIAGLVWLAARVYRVGMLMYGKRATIPEVWKWIRQK